MKKAINISLWVVLIAYLGAIYGFVEEKNKGIICNDINVSVVNNETNKLISNKSILATIKNSHIPIIGKQVNKINTFALENLFKSNATIKQVAIYTTIDGILNVEAEQREPILMVMNARMQQYYIDNEAYIIPIRFEAPAYCLFANGNIKETFNVNEAHTEKSLLMDTLNNNKNNISSIFKLSQYINSHNFWKNHISQIYVDGDNNLMVIPRVGAHVIILGDITNLDIKFKKLRSLYYAFNEIGWNDYKTINLKYSNQIVCTKR